MSAGAEPPPAVDEEQVRPVVSQPASTSSARLPQQPLPILDAGDEASPDSVSSSVGVDIMSVVGEEQMRPVAPQASTLSAGMQQEPLPLLVAGDEGSTDSVDTEIMSISAAGAARSRPYSPQPPTPSAKMQLKLQPFVKAGETKWQDPVSSSGDQSFGSSRANREMCPRSPQPSTSTAGMGPDWQPYIEPGDVEDHIYARDLSMRRTPMGFSSSSGLQLEMQPFGPAADAASSAEFTESDFLLDPQNISASWDRMRPWSPQPSTSSAAMMLELQLMPANSEVTSTDSIYPGVAQNTRSESETPAINLEHVTGPMVDFPPFQPFDYSTDDQDNSNPPIQKKLRRWPPQQLTSPSERVQLEMLARLQAEDTAAAGSDFCVAQNLSVSKGKGKGKKKRPWSAEPSTPTATIMQPLMKAIDTKADAFSMSVVQNISALVEEKNRRPLSPQPSTSSAPVQPLEARDEEPVDAGSASAAQNISGPVGEAATSEPTISTAATVKVEVPPEKKPGQTNPEDSVYAHVPHNISNIPQLRGLKAGRRHGRLRRLNTQNKMNEKYGPMIQYLGPMVAEEKAKQQTQQILIASALDHFANTINQIADKYEGKVDTTGFTERLEQFKKKMDERTEKRRKRNPNATEEAPPGPPAPPAPPTLSEEETNRRLREETVAAVQALLTGDRSKENPNRFAEIIKSFEAAFRPPFK